MSGIVDQCSVCKTGITPQQYSQTKKLFGGAFCANCIPDKKKADVQCSNCHAPVNEKQASFSKTAYGKVYCPEPKCQEVAEKEACAAIDAAQPPEIKIFNELGWKFGKGAATKDIDGKEVMVVYADRAKKGAACLVGGKPYQPDDGSGKTTEIDRELKQLFDRIDGKPEKKPPKPVVTEPKKIAAPQSETGGLGNSLATIQDITLSPENIIALICPKASMNEAVLFLQVCKLRQLNPFIPGEVFLIKMDESEPAVTVVGKYAFLKKADAHPDYMGYTAGIIVMDVEGKMVEREGTFYMPKGKNWKEGEVFETLVGGWARIKRKGREDFVEKVALQEAIKMKRDGTPNRGWRDQPATMARKVAVVRGHREAFPAELGGLYDRSELGEEI